MPLFVEKGDLVSKNVDVIVNASNVNLRMVEGVGRAIYHKAGDVELARACKAIGHCDVGSAVMTPSFGIDNTKAIIHAVGPIYINGKHDEEINLINAYKSSLKIALENNFKSIAFPLLSGEFNYPLKECYEIAINVFKDFLLEHGDIDIYLVMYKNFPEMLTEEDQINLTKYIIDNQSQNFSNQKADSDFDTLFKKYMKDYGSSIKEIAYKSNIKEKYLQSILDKKYGDNLTKRTILSISIGLKLNKEQTNELLISKGFVLEGSVISDLIICYFMEKEDFDIFEINSVLFKYGFHPLGYTE